MARFVLFSETTSLTRSDLWLPQMSDRTTRPWLQTPLDRPMVAADGIGSLT
jgi:hypothetical protein